MIRSLGRRGGERRYEENDFFCLIIEYDSLRCLAVRSRCVCDRIVGSCYICDRVVGVCVFVIALLGSVCL